MIIFVPFELERRYFLQMRNFIIVHHLTIGYKYKNTENRRAKEIVLNNGRHGSPSVDISSSQDTCECQINRLDN
jgi:hypothetical protein